MIQWIEEGDFLPPVGGRSTLESTFSTQILGGVDGNTADGTSTLYTEVAITGSTVGSGSSDMSAGGGGSTLVVDQSMTVISNATNINELGFQLNASNGGSTGATVSGMTSTELVVDDAGNSTWYTTVSINTANIGFASASFFSSGSGSFTLLNPSGGTITSSTSASESSSFEVTFNETGETTFTASVSSAGPDLGSWQATSIGTSERIFVSWDIGTATFSILTTVSADVTLTDTNGGSTATTTVALASTETTSTWHTLSNATATDTFADTVEAGVVLPGIAGISHWLPSGCNGLWVAVGGIAGLAAFCDAFNNVDEFVQRPSFMETSFSSFDGFQSYTLFGYVQVFGSGSNTTTDYVPATNGPQPIGGAYGILVPVIMPGYQPFYGIGSAHDLYGSYAISVADTVTATSEYAARTAGLTYLAGNVTHVLTVNSDDVLHMSGLITDSTTWISVASGGGYGDAGGPNTINFEIGIYDYTSYGTDGASSSDRLSFSESTSFTFERGQEYAVNVVPGYAPAAALPVFVEVPC